MSGRRTRRGGAAKPAAKAPATADAKKEPIQSETEPESEVTEKPATDSAETSQMEDVEEANADATEVIDLDNEEEDAILVEDVELADMKEPADDKSSKQNGQTDEKGKDSGAEKGKKETTQGSPAKLVDIPDFDFEEMRQKSKWSIRVYPISHEDAMMSGLPGATKVQDSFMHFSRRDQAKGQMELAVQNTQDAMVMMLRILRTPFTNRVITIELIKRAKQMRLGEESAAKQSENAEDKSDDPEKVPEKSDEGEEVKKEETKKEEAKNEGEKDEKQKKYPPGPKPWVEVREKATFVVDVLKAQKIKFVKKVKGDLRRRSVFVGNIHRGTTEELLKVIFPMANGILVRSTDDPNVRKAYIETCHRFNAMGFVHSYPALRMNGHDFTLSVGEADLEALGPEKSLKTEPAAGDQGKVKGEKGGDEEKEEEENNDGEKTEDEKKKEEGDKKEAEKKEEGDKKEAEGEKKEETKSGDKKEETTKSGGPDPEKKKMLRQQFNRTKKKRRRDFVDEIQREWNTSSVGAAGSGSRGRVSLQSRSLMGPIPNRTGGLGRGARGGGRLGMGRNVGPVSPLRSGGVMGQVPRPPLMSNLEGKIQNLMRLQNQLELTIHNQMNFLDQGQRAGQQAAAGAGGRGVGGMGGGSQGGGSFSNRGLDTGKNRGRERDRMRARRGSGSNQRPGKRDRQRMGGGQGGVDFPSKRFRRDSSGSGGGGFRYSQGMGSTGAGYGDTMGMNRSTYSRGDLGGGAGSLGGGGMGRDLGGAGYGMSTGGDFSGGLGSGNRYGSGMGMATSRSYSSGGVGGLGSARGSSWGSGAGMGDNLSSGGSMGGGGGSYLGDRSSYGRGGYGDGGAGLGSMGGGDSYMGSMSADYGSSNLSSSSFKGGSLGGYGSGRSLDSYSGNQGMLGGGSSYGNSYGSGGGYSRY